VKAKQIATVFNNGKTQVYNSVNATQKINHRINHSNTARKQELMKTGNQDIN
jgi:hypothetical protein